MEVTYVVNLDEITDANYAYFDRFSVEYISMKFMNS